MKRISTIVLCCILLATLAAPVNAQEQKPGPPHSFYKVVFVISELENGAATNQRRYVMMAREDRPTVIKTGSRVPIATGGKDGQSTQFQYMDVGFNAQVNISMVEGQISLNADIDLSSIVPADKDVPSSITAPMVRQVRQNINALVENGKPEVISVTDDVN